MTNKLLSVDETCKALGVARSTIYDWWATGRGPRYIKLPNRQIRVPQEWLDDWLLGLEGGEAA